MISYCLFCVDLIVIRVYSVLCCIPFNLKRTLTNLIKYKTMNYKFILKGVLLYITAITVTIFIMGVESIYDNGYFIPSVIICAVLCYTCYKLISEKEFKILTFTDNLEE